MACLGTRSIERVQHVNVNVNVEITIRVVRLTIKQQTQWHVRYGTGNIKRMHARERG